jgi:hypothetical protein
MLEDEMKQKSRNRLLILLMFLLIVTAACDSGSSEEESSPVVTEETAVEPAEQLPETTQEAVEPTEEVIEEPTAEVTEEAIGPTPKPGPQQSVALLVIDDFTGEEFIEGGNDDDGEFCTMTPEGQIFKGEGLIFKGEGLATEWVNIPDVTHGELVYNQLLDLLSTEYGAPDVSITGSTLNPALNWMGAAQIQSWDESGVNILLVPVDTQHYRSDVIADRVEITMEVIRANWDVRNFVWNMSFGFIPCDVETELPNEVIEGQLEALLSYVELQALRESLNSSVGEEPGGEELGGEEYPFLSQNAADNLFYDKIRVAYANGFYQDVLVPNEPINFPDVESDPFYLLSQSYLSGGDGVNVYPIAAAGNSGLDEPFAPAIWPGFLAISSEDLDITKAEYANDGELIIPHELIVDAATTVKGTSFAAPRMSYLAAEYLLLGGPMTCAGAISAATPPFNFDLWLNLPLGEAKLAYCSDFPMLTP